MNIENNIVEGSNNCELSVIFKFDAILLIRDILKKLQVQQELTKKVLRKLMKMPLKFHWQLKV